MRNSYCGWLLSVLVLINLSWWSLHSKRFLLRWWERAMRNIFLIARREYLERVRTKAFMIFTLLMPALMFAFTTLPAKFMMKSDKPKNILVVTSSPDFGKVIKDQLASHAKENGMTMTIVTSTLADIDQATAEQELSSKKYDSLLWVTDRDS